MILAITILSAMACAEKEYQDLFGNCQPCRTGCATCYVQFTCITCDTSISISSVETTNPDGTPGLICRVCNAGQYDDGSGCQSCSPTCNTCSSYGYCNSCRTDVPITSTPTTDDNGRSVFFCTLTCPVGTYDNGNTQCPDCDSSCATCHLGYSCDSCKPGYDGTSTDNEDFTRGLICTITAPCSAGQYKDGAGACQDCDSSCATCSFASTCDTCASGYTSSPTTNTDGSSAVTCT